jgi:integrase
VVAAVCELHAEPADRGPRRSDAAGPRHAQCRRLLARIPASPKPPDTLTAAEVEKILKHIETDRDAIAWQLAFTGLRRGEIAGLRWSDVDLDADTLTVAQNRISYSKTIVEGTPKSRASRRVLPLPDRLAAALRTAKRQ